MFLKEYDVSFSDASINSVVNETIFSNFLSCNSRSANVYYIHVTSLEALLPLFEDRSVEEETSKTLGVTHVDYATV